MQENIDDNSDVSVLLITLNNEQDLHRVLSSIKLSNPGQIIVSDGGSNDQSVSIAKEYTSDVYVGPRGRARQMNYGLEMVNRKYLLLIEGDHEYPEGFITDLKDEFCALKYFGLQATLVCKFERNFWERGISCFYSIHQRRKGIKPMIGGPSIFLADEYKSTLNHIDVQGFGIDTTIGQYLENKGLSVGLGKTIAFQYQELDINKFLRKYFNYGRGDYEFYLRHKKEWKIPRKIKSITHIMNRYIIAYPIISLKASNPIIAIPYLWLAGIVRYSGWIYEIFRRK